MADGASKSTPSGDFKAPLNVSKLAKPSGLPRPASTGSGRATPTRAMSREALNIAGARAVTDDWIVGDRCYVNGVKSGKVAFLGETRFAAGEWAGVVLDDPTGKNDGSVNGVRYFQCPAKHGVFCKINKLERRPTGDTGGDGVQATGQDAASGANAKAATSTPVDAENDAQATPARLDFTTTADSTFGGEGGGDVYLSPNSPSSVGGDFLRSSTPEAAVPTSGPGTPSSLKVGDRVIVSGNKSGVLRYLGVTAFKEGVWAGVELDQPLGKNDGSVDGKRYFACKPRFGLFAPASKVIRAGSPTAPVLPSMNASYAGLTTSRSSLAGTAPKKLPPAPRQTLTSAMRIQRASQSRTGSQESLSSISSIHSSASVNRRKAMAAERAGSAGPNNPALLSSPVFATLQESLKEKEEHVEQLLRERDIDRTEMARTAQMVDQAQQELADMKTEAERTLDEVNLKLMHLQTTLEQSEKERKRIQELFDDEKRRCEDLQFRVEEETITRSEAEARISELEKRLIEAKTTADGGATTAANAQSVLEEKSREADEIRKQVVAQKARVDELEKAADESRKTEMDLRASILRLETTLEAVGKEHEERVQLLERDLNVAKQDLQSEVGSVDGLKSSYQTMQAQFVEMENLAKMYAERSGGLEQKLAVKAEELERAQAEKKSLEQHLRQEFQLVQDQLAAAKTLAEETGQRLTKELAEKDGRISELASESAKLLDDISRSSAQLEGGASQVQVLENELSKERTKVAEAQALCDGLKRELEMVVSKEQLTAANNLAEQERVTKILAEKDGRISDLSSETAKLLDNVSRLSAQLECHESQRVELEADLTKERAKLAEAQARCDGLKRELETAVSSQNEVAGAALESARKEYDVISSKLRETEKECGDLKTQIQVLTAEGAGKVQEIEKLRKDFEAAVTTQNDATAAALESARKEYVAVSTKLRETEQECSNLQMRVQKLTEEGATFAQENDNLKKELTDLRESQATASSQNETIIASLESARKDYDLISSKLRDTEKDRDDLKMQIQTLVAEGSAKMQEVEKLRTELVSSMTTQNEAAGSALENTRKEFEAVSSKLHDVEQECGNLRARIQHLTEEGAALIQDKENLSKEISDFARLKEQFGAKCEELEEMKKTQLHLSNQLDAQKKAYVNLQAEKGNSSAAVEKLEQEKFDLLEKLSDAETKISELARLAVKAPEKAKDKVDAENNDAENHVNFLNSIIASQQQQIDDLNLKVEILTHGGVEGLGMSNGLPKVPAPRNFCDICDEFGDHDTDECPKQANITQEEETHSHHHGKRGGDARPYCDNCEVFGHSTQSCMMEDHETF